MKQYYLHITTYKGIAEGASHYYGFFTPMGAVDPQPDFVCKQYLSSQGVLAASKAWFREEIKPPAVLFLGDMNIPKYCYPHRTILGPRGFTKRANAIFKATRNANGADMVPTWCGFLESGALCCGSLILKIKAGASQFNLAVIKSPIHRYGVIAGENIPARCSVIEYTGKLYNRVQTKKLYAETPDKDLIYVWQISPGAYWYMDGRVGGSGAEFINHSCDPNLRVVFRGKRIFYYSRRVIKQGEELTIDYNFDKRDDIVPCKCGSDKCRGTINVN